MGLQFSKLEPVQFGDLVATPKLTNEVKLRLQTALQKAKDQTTDDLVEMTNQLAAAFPDHKEEVATFIESNMTMDDIAQLTTYLLAGDAGLARLKSAQGGANGE